MSLGSPVIGTQVSASGGTPAGSNTEIQYNDSGAFGASAQLTFSTSTGLAISDNAKITGPSQGNALQIEGEGDAVIRLNNTFLINEYAEFVFATDDTDGFSFYSGGQNGPDYIAFFDYIADEDYATYTTGGPLTLGTLELNSKVSITDTTESTSTTNGALVVDGGIGCAKDLRVGDDIFAGDNVVAVNGFGRFEDFVRTGATGFFVLGPETLDNSWRIAISGTSLVIQRRESGVWVTKQEVLA